MAHLGQLRRQSLVLRLLLLSQRLRLLVGGGQLLALILQSLDLNLLLVDAAVGVVQLRLGLGEVLCEKKNDKFKMFFLIEKTPPTYQ